MWTVSFVNDEVAEELVRQPDDVRAKFRRIARLIESAGLERVHEPYVKHLEGKLWEIRLIGRDGIARAIYVTANVKRVVVLRVFTKKTEKTPRNEIELALRRVREVK